MSQGGESRGGWQALAWGAVSALALPPVHAIPVLLLAIPALLRLLARSAHWQAAGWVGFCFGFGLNLAGLYWITEAILIESARFWWLVPLAVPALAAVVAAFVAVPCAVAWAVPPGWRRVLVLSGAWVLADLARQFIATGFPWNLWGSVWAIPGVAGDVLIQPAAVLGVHGLTAATLVLASTPVLGLRAMVCGIVGLAAWVGFGVWRLDAAILPASQVKILLVQGNVAQGQKWNQAVARDIFERYLGLTRDGVARAEAASPARIVVVWPETAFPGLLDSDQSARAAIMQAAGAAWVLAGSVRFDAQNRPRNSLMALGDAGPPVAVYDKWHLVPFGEYQPGWLPLGIQIVPGGGFAAGPGPATLHLANLPPVGAMICYEAIFPAQVVDRNDRPDWLVNVTNDAWFGNSAGPRQHLAAVRLRAVEEGLPVMRAANTGISAGFDPFGREIGRIGMNREGVLLLDLPAPLPATIFARLGLIGPAALAPLLVIFGIVGLRRRT